MPELPEVETIVRGLRNTVLYKEITRIVSLRDNTIHNHLGNEVYHYGKNVCTCSEPITKIKQASRSTWFCPVCQNISTKKEMNNEAS